LRTLSILSTFDTAICVVRSELNCYTRRDTAGVTVQLGTIGMDGGARQSRRNTGSEKNVTFSQIWTTYMCRYSKRPCLRNQQIEITRYNFAGFPYAQQKSAGWLEMAQFLSQRAAGAENFSLQYTVHPSYMLYPLSVWRFNSLRYGSEFYTHSGRLEL